MTHYRPYTATLIRGMVARTITVNDTDEAAAYRQAESLCEDGEYVRGVTPAPDAQAWRYMTETEDRETYGGR